MKSERLGYEHYLKEGFEKMMETFIKHCESKMRELGDGLTPATLADIMNEADDTVGLLDMCFTDDQGKFELLIDLYECFDFEFPFDEGFTVDDFFINYKDVGYVDIGTDTEHLEAGYAECLDIHGKPIDATTEDWFSRIIHRRWQPVKFRDFTIDSYKVQYLGLYKRWDTQVVPKHKVQTQNPYK